MGSHVVLDIIPQQMNPAAWADAYDETARLLAAHPARLLGHGFRTAAGVRVPVLTRAVEQGGPDPAERRWCVAGDRATLGTGERQRMYRDLGRYTVHDGGAAPHGRHPRRGGCCPRRRGRDGGHERSFAPSGGAGVRRGRSVRALASCALRGGDDRRDALPGARARLGQPQSRAVRQARRWAKSVLGQTLALPVRLWRCTCRAAPPHLEGDALEKAVDRLHAGESAAADARERRTAPPPPPRTPAPRSTRSRVWSRRPSSTPRSARGSTPWPPPQRRHSSTAGGPVSTGAARRAIASLLALRGPTLTEGRLGLDRARGGRRPRGVRRGARRARSGRPGGQGPPSRPAREPRALPLCRGLNNHPGSRARGRPGGVAAHRYAWLDAWRPSAALLTRPSSSLDMKSWKGCIHTADHCTASWVCATRERT